MMNCPYCDKYIPGITGLQEAQNFSKHLRKCKKHPDRQTLADEDGKLKQQNPPTTLLDAVEIRANSGQ